MAWRTLRFEMGAIVWLKTTPIHWSGFTTHSVRFGLRTSRA